MVALSPAFLTLAVFCSSALAAPWPTTTRQHTHRVRSLPNGLLVKTYHPSSTFKTFSDGIEPPVSSGNGFASSFKDSAMSFINQELGSDQVEFRSSFEATHAKHVYVHQKINGIRVANGVAHSTLNKSGKVVAFSSSFVTPQNQPATTAKITEAAAIKAVTSKAGATPTSRKVDLEYFSKDDGSLVLSYVIQAHVDGDGHLVEVFVDAVTGEIAGLIDFTTSLTYHVVPVSKQSPDLGLETLVDPEDLESSPKGWSANGSTEGNNVIVAKNDEVSSQTSDKGFETEFDPNAEPSSSSQVDLARANVFYVVNRVHDIAYRYGFTEEAFNFQDDNNGKGGAGNDRVLVSVQDSNGVNNADMTTPGDGENGRMRMYLWDITNPQRDGALENDIVVHEFTHGITNRLTGGGTGRCLGTDEAGGMGEGWSDAVAFWMEQTSAEQKDYTMGSYVTGNPNGIRSHPYSMSSDVNPYTYATLKEKHEVHDIGEIWANTLINVYGALVEASGFDAEAVNNAELTTGNAIWFHLFIDSLSIQNCNPTFVNARDAWIQADKDRYDGANTCTLWKAFASRGLGVGASEERVDNNDIPEECNGAQPSPPAPTDSEPVPEPTETEDEPEPSETETSDEPEPTETEDVPQPSEDPEEVPFPTDVPEPMPEEPTDTETDLPFPSEIPNEPMPPVDLPGSDHDEPSDNGEMCPLLGIPKSSLPRWWPFDFC